MFLLARCGDDKVVNVGASALQVTFLESDFRGGSIRIVGRSSSQENDRLRCVNSAEQCFEVTERVPTLLLDGLCPSVSESDGLWDFSYDVFHGTNCQGPKRNETVLNAHTAQEAIVCLDEADALTRQNAVLF